MRAGLALLFLQLIPAVLYAQSNAAGTAAAPYQDLRTAALADTRAYDLLESLTTEVGPRMPGTAGDAAGVAWAIRNMERLGFSVSTEAVKYPVWERGVEECQVLSPFPQKLTVTALGGSIGTKAKGLTAEVVAFPDYAALVAADASLLRGKIAYIANRMERSRDGSGYGQAVIARSAGASAAAKKGAVALLIRSIGTDANARTPHTGMMRYDNTPTRIPAAALSNVDADLLSNILKRGQPVRLKLRLDARTRKADYTGSNVIGDFKGSDKANEIVLLGAHLDSWDLGTGALDDGAGVAITMAAAVLAQEHAVRSGKPLRRTLRVVLFANEEQGLYGGNQYAANRRDSLLSTLIIAAESDFGAGRIYQFDTKLAANQLMGLSPLLQALAPLGITYGNNDASGGPDLRAMAQLGAPVAELAQDGTGYFDIHHTAADTLDKVDPEALKQNVAAYAVFARFFATDW
jgi:carboxypeptidase Q